MDNIKPGQVYEDTDHAFDTEAMFAYSYVVCCQLYAGVWECVQFMQWDFGASGHNPRLFSDEEIAQLHYKGHVKDLH